MDHSGNVGPAITPPITPQNPQQKKPCPVTTQLPGSGVGYILKSNTSPTRQFGTSSTIASLQAFAEARFQAFVLAGMIDKANILPNLNDVKYAPLRIGEISISGGGKFGEHLGEAHAFGRGVDIGLFRYDGQNLAVYYTDAQNYDRGSTQMLVDMLDADPNVSRMIFNDPQVTGTKLERDKPGTHVHDNHVHVEFMECFQ
jgi:hypothetical protein